jgi:hypothetical protein
MTALIDSSDSDRVGSVACGAARNDTIRVSTSRRNTATSRWKRLATPRLRQ